MASVGGNAELAMTNALISRAAVFAPNTCRRRAVK